ncbi:MAG: hypothetical protein ACYDA9_17825 [Terriglobia bacterium]
MTQGWSQAVDKMNENLHRASYRSRQEQKADRQPNEAAKTFKLALSFRRIHAP